MPARKTLEFRCGLAATWTSVNPILLQGEPGAETDTLKFKIGDGVTAWNSLAYATTTAGATQNNIIHSFGDGSDGNVTISSGVTTLASDAYYNNLTINGTGSLNPNGYRIFVKNVLDLSAAPSGAISVTGLPGGSTSTYTPGAIPAAPTTGSLGTGVRGVAGIIGSISTVTNGTNANASSLNNGGDSNVAGNGGSGLAGANGTGGTGAASSASFPINRYAINLIQGITVISGGMGGASGSSGMGDAHYQGGGSGAGANGGGIVAIYANIINRGTNTNTGIIQANGGNGGNGAAYTTTISIGGGGAGGSGGGGGWIYIVYNTLAGSTITNALQANGGNGGDGHNGNNRSYHWLVKETVNAGTSWTISDDFLPTTSDARLATAFAKDLLGNLFTVGQGRNLDNATHWLVRKSTDDGVTWAVVDDFVYNSGTGKNSQAQAICVDLLGNIFVSGLGDNGGSSFHWVTRKSTDNGTTWATVDDYQYPAGTDTKAAASGIDSLGNIFVSGYGRDASSSRWVTRKSADNGTTWANVDDFVYSGGVSNAAAGFTSDNAGNIFVGGFGGDVTPVYHWVVRKSADNGTTWTTVDDFVYTGGAYSNVNGMFKDLLGNIYATGFGCDVSTVSYRWVTRKSPDNGVTWATVDDYVYVGNTYTIASVGVADLSGNIYTTGLGDDALGNQRWITRQSPNNGTSWSTVDDYLYPGGDIIAGGRGIGIDGTGNVFVVGEGVGPGTSTANGGDGGSGGNSGTIFVMKGLDSSVLANIVNNNSVGSAGTPASGATGGSGGAGGVAQANL